MRRLVWVAAVACLLAPVAAAQNLSFVPQSDTAAIMLFGDTASLRIDISTCSGVSAYDIRIFYDPTNVSIESVDSVPGYGLPAPTRVDGANYVDVAAAGTGWASCTTRALSMRFRLDSAAVEGSQLSMLVRSLTSFSSTDLLPTHATGIGRVCHGTFVWGDLDSSRTVTSRDALIAITAAVGLPAPGFQVAAGDVDEDGEVTTRDALYILSGAIGLESLRAGEREADRCAPYLGAPAPVVLYRNTAIDRAAAGDTAYTNVPVQGAGPTNYRPAWAPDGTRVLFSQFVSGFSTDVISSTLDGSQVDTLRLSTSADYYGVWSPDGTQIAFISNRSSPYSVWVADADGQNQVRVSDSIWVDHLAWSPDGSTIAFTGYHQSTCCPNRLWTVAPDGSGQAEVFATSSTYTPTEVAWSPGSDSLAFRRPSTNALYVVAASGDTAPVRRAHLLGGQYFPTWVPAGIGFTNTVAPYEFILRAPDGRLRRMLRSDFQAVPHTFLPATVWVDVVDIAQDSVLGLSGPVQLTLTVTNSDASPNVTSPIRWVSRDTTAFTVSATGLLTPLGPSGAAYVVASAGGWRSDSAWVDAPGFAPPRPAPVRRRP